MSCAQHRRGKWTQGGAFMQKCGKLRALLATGGRSLVDADGGYPSPLRGGSTGVSRSGWGYSDGVRYLPLRHRDFDLHLNSSTSEHKSLASEDTDRVLGPSERQRAFACWPPSISMTTRAPNETKSTMYGPIGACRRKRKPRSFNSRNFTQSFTSCGVRRFRRARAVSFAKCFLRQPLPDRPSAGRPPRKGEGSGNTSCAFGEGIKSAFHAPSPRTTPAPARQSRRPTAAPRPR